MEWYQRTVSLAPGPGAQAFVDLGSDIPVDERAGMTIIRWLIHLAFRPGTFGVFAPVSYGISMWPLETVVAGQFPEPEIDVQETNWVLQRSNIVEFFPIGTLSSPGMYREVFDIQTARKYLGARWTPVLVVGCAGASGYTVEGVVRLLVKKS